MFGKDKNCKTREKRTTNTNFLDTYHLNDIYGDAENANLTKIDEGVYHYPRVWETELVS